MIKKSLLQILDMMIILKSFERKNVSINQTAFKINFIESIPKNKSGKVMYSKLNEYES